MLKSRRDSLLLFGIPFLATFLAYLKTVCPTVYTGDSGEFSLVISTLGIAHPPGYPLLTLLGKVFITIIPGNQAHVLNTLSALLASASAGLGAYVVRAIMFLPENRNEIQAILISILTAILWGYSNALWASAVGIEVYTFSVCLTMLSLFALLRFFDTGQVRYLLFSIYIFCLGLTNHLSIAALAIPLFVAMLRARLPLRVWLLSISLFILALSAYLYLPIRSAHNPISDWDHPARLSTLIAHITARRYQGLVSGFTVGNYYENIWRSLIIIGEQFPLWLGILGIIGIAFAPGTRKNIRLTLVIIVIFNLLTVGLYDIPDIEQYYLISIFLSCVGLIFLVKWVLSTVLPRRWEIGAIVVMAIIAIGALGANYKQNDQSNNLLARDYGANILSSIPSNSVLVLVGDNASTSVNYLHYVEHIRLDLEIYDPIVTVGLLRDRLGLARGVSGPSEQELCMKILQGPKAYIVKEHLLRRGAPINYDALTLSPMGLVYHVGKWPLVPAIRENE
ncbi:MAG TPA: hypothetical protein DCZ43_12950, partial [candidate division Zixibacteria bacterium]|nr:hypothetical protein [candidate division Zixibacteria bacterium]